MTQQQDIVIVGGGMAGASLACALSGLGLRISVVEAVASARTAGSTYDDRAIALAYGSRRIFEAIGVWEGLADAAAPIRHIHVSERGGFGAARLDSEEQGVDALGYVVTARELGNALLARARALPDVRWIQPATVHALRVTAEGAVLGIERDGCSLELSPRLVIACDGGNSPVRELLGVSAVRREYGQCAVATNVTPQRPHRYVAYERFTANGPLALLPMRDGRCAVVWTLPEQRRDEVLGLSDAHFLAELQTQFGQRLGRLLRVGRRQAYPISLAWTRELVHERVVLVGNAAHTLHPVAGQGFNLGLRDVAALADVVAEAVRAGSDPGARPALARYGEWRAGDQRSVAAFTDVLARLFTVPLGPVALGRNLGLLAFDLLPDIKQRFSRRTMGLAGRLPRLARGLSADLDATGGSLS